jgi:hypothetical protein
MRARRRTSWWLLTTLLWLTQVHHRAQGEVVGYDSQRQRYVVELDDQRRMWFTPRKSAKKQTAVPSEQDVHIALAEKFWRIIHAQDSYAK